MLKSFREHLQYRFDDLFSRGSWGKFLLLLTFTACVVLFGMLAYFLGLFSPANGQVEGIGRAIDAGFWDTLWWSAKHVVDPSFFASNYGATAGVVAISLVVSIAGLVIFGALISFISTGIEERLEALRRGNSAVKESGHVLILGWNEQVVEVIAILAARLRRLRVVILAPRDVTEMQESLRASGGYRLGAKIVLRCGSPGNRSELERVAAGRARSVMVLSTSRGGGDADIEAVKTLLALAVYPWPSARPRIACEIARARGVDIARSASGGQVPIVSSGETVSRMLFQASRQSGVVAIYDELFSFVGAGIRFKQVTGCAGMRFGDAAYAFPTATLIGISTAGAAADGTAHYHCLLGPPASRIIGTQEWLIFLAHSDDIVDQLDRPVFRSTVSMPKAFLLLPTEGSSGGQQAPSVYTSEVSRGEKYLAPSHERILVLGCNPSLHDLIAEHDACVGAETEIVVVSGHGDDKARAILAQSRTKPRAKLGFVQADTLNRAALQALAPHACDAIVVIADDSRGEIDPDARTVMTLVLLQDLLRSRPQRPRVVAEIHDAANEALVAGLGVDDLVISPRVVSRQLVQISQQAVLAEIYHELLSSGGVEIYLKPASRYVVPGRDCVFNDVVYSAQRLGEVALGVRLAKDNAGTARGLRLNPPKDARLGFVDGDMIVVLAEELYDRRV
ncbi:MAG: hypothetical protein H0W83_02240 [Planctomycetes bacterium]|nr:hypothetical protein [Planctomycetota bacterium]